MRTAPVVAEASSATWPVAAPAASVVVATHDRSAYLPELVAALERQIAPAGGVEVVVVDDGSADGTWAELERLAASTPLALLVLRVEATGGPSVPRNTGVARCRGTVLALTDDDCLPDPGWLQALCQAAGQGVVAQGATRPGPGTAEGPWDRTIAVGGVTGLYETCNLALPRALFLRLGGFPHLDAVGGRARGFGEDVLLGAAAAREAGVTFVPAATVQHRWLAGAFRDHLASRRRLAGFPLLVRQVPELRDHLWHQVFLTRRTAATDLALAGVVAAATGRRAGLWAALPWLVLAGRDARGRAGRPLPVRLAQVAVADGVAAAALARGSARHRRLVL